MQNKGYQYSRGDLTGNKYVTTYKWEILLHSTYLLLLTLTHNWSVLVCTISDAVYNRYMIYSYMMYY